MDRASLSWVTTFLKIWPWKSKVKVMGGVKFSHNVGLTSYRFTSLSFHVNRPSHSWDTVFSKFDLKKSRVKVMGEVTVQSHNVGLTSYRLTSLSFHVKRPSQSWVTTFFKIWPWKSRVKVMGGVTVQSHNVGLTSYRFTSLSFHVNRPSHSWDTVFSKFDLKGQGQMTMALHNYRSRQFHRTSNGTDPSRGFRDMGSAKSGPSAAWFDKFLAHGQAHVGQMDK